MSSAKVLNDLKIIDISTLFGNLTEYEHESKRLKISESNLKKKEKFKEESRNISLEASTSKAKLEEYKYSTDENSSKEEEMRLFVKCYDIYIKRNGLNHSNTKLVKLMKSNPPKKLEDKKKDQKQLTGYEYGEPRYYKIYYPSLNKRKSN